MLDPGSRRHLLETLRPPAGYALDYAVGTTYSLDLLALLTAPLAFTMLHWEEDVDGATTDPIALLESIRRNAGQIAIFCQAGQIAVPKSSQLLYGYLESSVHEVTPQNTDRAFHPKVWALRYRPSSEDDAVRYRLLCMSRNLTFDRSWDTALVLEGELTNRQLGYGSNRPLGEFFTALPNLAIHPLAGNVAARVEEIGAEIRRVRFHPPAGFEEVSFHPIGFTHSRQWPFGREADRLLVISPFVADPFLTELSRQAQQSILVSRLDSLQTANQATLAEFDEVFVLNDAANVEVADPDNENAVPDGAEESAASEYDLIDTTLHGLHAKLYVLDRGWYTDIWTGSANATNAAFHGNVEFLVRLHGKKSQVGIDKILGTLDEPELRRLLEQYHPAAEAPQDRVAETLEQLIDAARRSIVGARMSGEVTTLERSDQYSVSLKPLEELELQGQVQISAWPITLRPETAARVLEPNRFSDVLVEFSGMSFEALTRFFAFEITVTVEGRVRRSGFVLNIPLSGLPEDRNERLLNAMLKNKAQVLRLILLLLMEGETTVPALLDALDDDLANHRSGSAGIGQIPLFETYDTFTGPRPWSAGCRGNAHHPTSEDCRRLQPAP